MTMLCVPLTGSTCEQMLRDLQAAAAAGADMVELRLDYLQDHSEPAIRKLMAAADKFPGEVIATCRLASEGGVWDGDESRRVSLLEQAGLAGADYIDFEHAAWQASANVRQKIGLVCEVGLQTDRPRSKLILSKHNFERTPTNLDTIFAELAAEPAHVVKLVCKANRITDAVRILEALRNARKHPPKPPLGKGGGGRTETDEIASETSNPPLGKGGQGRVIALSMGEAGTLARVLAGKFDALLTFASLEAGKESAPGQLTLAQMRSLYRWDSLRSDTLVYGVIGCPVAHSMSPAIMNAAFGATGHNGVYLPLLVEPAYEDFAAFVGGCIERPWLDLRGCSVTIPHKQNLLRFVEQHGGEIESLTRRIGAANTLVIQPCGTGVSPVESHLRDAGATREEDTGVTPVPHKLYAYNTDYRGAMNALLAGLEGTGKDLHDAAVTVLGAGGASRAIVAGLRDAGASVTIYNSTAERAKQLADEFGCQAKPWEQRGQLKADVVVNCTSIGMWPNVDDSPLPETTLRAGTAVFDTVYNPIETRLLRESRLRGCRVIDGVAMFVGQAAAQFRLWTNLSPPTAIMRQVVIQRLSR